MGRLSVSGESRFIAARLLVSILASDWLVTRPLIGRGLGRILATGYLLQSNNF